MWWNTSTKTISSQENSLRPPLLMRLAREPTAEKTELTKKTREVVVDRMKQEFHQIQILRDQGGNA